METKKIKITPPEGFEIDKENSTFECIKFKPIKKQRWRDNEDDLVKGYYINVDSQIINSGLNYNNTPENHNIFATEKQAKSALAMARISQIMANDERFGGVVTDEEWSGKCVKYVIEKHCNEIYINNFFYTYRFLAFHTEAQLKLFLEENEDLVKDYLMFD